MTFWFRAVLSDRNSYWLDELFSVESYVLPHANILEAIRDLIDTSVHPPLYQFVLYFWVQLFGSTETATRTLSNLYVTIAIVILHRWILQLHGAAIANGAAITFALSYTVTFFGNETRSYAQTLLLVVLSSYALFRYVELLPSKRGLRRILPGSPALVLVAANSALLLTHYYNLFYWAAQAIFAAALVFWTSEPASASRVFRPWSRRISSGHDLHLLLGADGRDDLRAVHPSLRDGWHLRPRRSLSWRCSSRRTCDLDRLLAGPCFA